MRTILAVLVLLLSGCASDLHASIQTTVERSFVVYDLSGRSLSIENFGPAPLSYSYEPKPGTRREGRIAQGEREELDVTGVHELRLECATGEHADVRLLIWGGSRLRLSVRPIVDPLHDPASATWKQP